MSCCNNIKPIDLDCNSITLKYEYDFIEGMDYLFNIEGVNYWVKCISYDRINKKVKLKIIEEN